MAKRKAVKKPVVKPILIKKGTVIVTKKLKGIMLKAAKRKKAGARRKLSDKQIAQLRKMHASFKYPIKELCDKFKISAPTLHNYSKR